MSPWRSRPWARSAPRVAIVPLRSTSARQVRRWLVDGALTAAVTGVQLGGLLGVGSVGVDGQRPVDVLGWVLVAFASLPLLVRRRLPWTVLLVTSVALIVYALLGYPFVVSGFGVLIALYGVAAQYPPRRSLGGVLLALVAMAVAHIQGPQEYPWSTVFGDLLATGAAWSLGDVTRIRWLRADALAERARQAELNREAHGREAVANERLRIARELHDVMAHSMSVIAVQAGVGRHVIDRDPPTASRALAVIEDTSRRTLTEMRQLLGVLRVTDVAVDDATAPPDGTAAAATRSPQPGLDRLEELLAAARAAGSVVTLSTSGTPHPLPSQLDLAAYRILQEALTNSAKHAGPAKVTVALTWRDDNLQIEVGDDGPGPASRPRSRPPGEGYGLIGLHERATSVGGDLQTGPGPRGGFLLRATLPLTANQAPTQASAEVSAEVSSLRDLR